MRAAVIRRYGAAKVFKLEDLADPVPKPGQILVRNEASSVNPIDWKIRSGSLGLLFGFRFPKILGFDVSGEVVGLGPDVKDFQPGDRVYARSDVKTGQAYAQMVALGAAAAAPAPPGLDSLKAAAIPLAGLTALQALRDWGKLGSGQQALILGASGGVGCFAVQIAKALGARVTGVCSKRNFDFVSGLGADEVADYKTDDLGQLQGPFQTVFDAVGRYSYFRFRSQLEPAGRFITTLPTPGVLFQMLTGNWISRRHARFIRVNPLGSDLRFLSKLVESEQLQVPIDSEFNLSEIAEAHRRSETGRARGKIVIRID